jgi:predicted acyl esterase
MALPPDPAVTGPSWRERWLERIALAADAPAVVDWLTHQERDAFWRHGSVNEAYGDIEVPVLAVGGWQDGYSNAIPRLLAGLSGPRMGVIGAWAHGYPHAAPPGPNIDFFALAVRWWDRWLRDDATALDGLPALSAFVGEGLPPEPFYAEAPGRWVAEEAWPSPRITGARWALDEGGVLEAVGPAGSSGPVTVVEVRTDQTVGIAGGEWCPFGTGGRGPELPGDQAPDDARSVCFDSAPLAERLEILGAPIVRLRLPPDTWPGLVVARLCDVWPDGRSTRVTYTVRHVGAPGDPGPAGGVLELRLNDVGHAFLAGHRIRVALSTTSWPMVWPEAVPSTLAFVTGASELELPVRPSLGTPPAADLGTAWRPAPRVETITAGRHERVVTMDGDRQVVRNTIDGGRSRVLATDVTCGTWAEDIASIVEGDPLSARMTAERRVTLEHPDGTRVSVRGWLELTAGAVAWELRGRLVAEEAEAVVADRSFERTIARRVP